MKMPRDVLSDGVVGAKANGLSNGMHFIPARQ